MRAAADIVLSDAQEAFWQRYCDHAGHRGRPVDCDFFGGPDIADDLLALILAGRKRATCSNARWIARGLMPIPRPGALSIATDASGTPACVIRTESVILKPFNEVTPGFAWREGEGTRLLHDWRREHLRYFHTEARENGYVFRETDTCAFETFTCVWRG